MAAATENSAANSALTTGLGLFTDILVDAFTRDASGYFKADYNHDGTVVWDELALFVKNGSSLSSRVGAVVVEKDIGDQSVFSMNMWSPVAYRTDDFNDTLSTVPEPSTVLLLVFGIMGLAGARRLRQSSSYRT